jgi:hypothetical protein
MRLAVPALTLAVVAATTAAPAADSKKDTRVYEMRVYYAAPGKLDALNTRFKNHTAKLFDKHGMTNVGYFVPVDNKDNKLVYFLAYPSKAARDKAWGTFQQDPDWKQARADSEKDGKLLTKVETRFLTATDYSPALHPDGKGEHTYELRTYTASKGNRAALDARFRDHTMKLFEKHGMTNVVYWHPLAGEKGADDTLVYLLAHKSPDAAKASFDAFRQDPAWVAARKASEEKAGGSLTVEKGVVSEFLKPMDYSPLK